MKLTALFALLVLEIALFSQCVGCGPGHHRVGFGGDSVSIMYTKPTLDLLAGNGWSGKHASPPGALGIDFPTSDNWQNSAHALQNVDRWIADWGALEVITWNVGIWDCTDQPTSPQEYASNLVGITQKLKATGARLVFFTTTEIVTAPGCAEERNAIARQVLSGLGVEIADLYAFTKGRVDWHGRGQVQNPNDVHFTEAANLEIAKFVAGAVMR